MQRSCCKKSIKAAGNGVFNVGPHPRKTEKATVTTLRHVYQSWYVKNLHHSTTASAT